MDTVSAEFLKLMNGVDVIGADELANGSKNLDKYGTISCFIYGGTNAISNLTPSVLDQISGQIQKGATFISNAEDCGGKVFDALGIYKYGTRSNWYPALKDSSFISSYKDNESLFNGVATYSGDPKTKDVDYWTSGEFDNLIFRVDNSKSYTGRYGVNGSALKDPNLYLASGYGTGFSVSAINDKWYPEWNIGAGKAILASGLNWTFDQSTKSGGYIGIAGRKILHNIANGLVGSLSDLSRSYKNFKITANKYAMDAGASDAGCKSEFGNSYALADWTDIKAFYNDEGNLTNFFNGLKIVAPGTEGDSSYNVSYNGKELYSSDRHYFISRHDHNKPSNYLVHSEINNYELSLGSWHGDRPALCIISKTAPTANAGADQTVTEGDNVTLDASGSSDSDGTISSYEWKEDTTTVLSTSSSFSKSDFTVGTHTITLSVTDNDGATASDKVVVRVVAGGANQTVILKKTGQTTSYTDYDDGYYQKGQTPRYTRASNSVTDELTHLMWQDDATPETMAWSDAQSYCSNLSLDGYTDWRLPTRKELVGLSDYGRYSPAIDPIFQNTISNIYWSSTTYASNTSLAWIVDFYNGYQVNNVKTSNNYVRCVRAGQ